MTSTDPRFAALALAAQHIEAARLEAAREALSSLVNSALALDDRPEDLLYFLLAAGLSKRLDGPTYEEINLYLRDYDVPQIRLFNLLAERVPTMALGTWLANKMLVRTLREHARPTLVDFGTGTGRQMVTLLHMLSEDPRALVRLRLVLIEPDPNSLKSAVERAVAAAAERGLSVEIQAIPKLAEEMDDHDWASLAPREGTLVINESFTLHHVSDDVDGADGRDAVLARIKSLEPELFVATEPDVDHDTMRLSDRLANCHQHFRSMFAQIDRLDIAENDRAAIKVCFFGREMEDILGAPDATRAERHDRAHRWLERMRASGLTPIDLDELNLPAPEVSGVELFTRDGHLSLGFGGEPLLAVLAASGRGAAHEESVAMPGRMSIPAPRARHAAFDAAAHVAVLAAVALADGVIDPRERTVLERHAQLTNTDVDSAIERANDLQFLTRLQTSERTRRAILRDCIVLARLSGEYRPSERARIAEIATALGMPERAVHEAEQRADAVAPPVIDHAPAWLKDYWALAQGR
jgi:tellurite resistance protein